MCTVEYTYTHNWVVAQCNAATLHFLLRRWRPCRLCQQRHVIHRFVGGNWVHTSREEGLLYWHGPAGSCLTIRDGGVAQFGLGRAAGQGSEPRSRNNYGTKLHDELRCWKHRALGSTLRRVPGHGLRVCFLLRVWRLRRGPLSRGGARGLSSECAMWPPRERVVVLHRNPAAGDMLGPLYAPGTCRISRPGLRRTVPVAALGTHRGP